MIKKLLAVFVLWMPCFLVWAQSANNDRDIFNDIYPVLMPSLEWQQVQEMAGVAFADTLTTNFSRLPQAQQAQRKALYLGMYIADMAYTCNFGKKDQVGRYLHVLEKISGQMKQANTPIMHGARRLLEAQPADSVREIIYREIIGKTDSWLKGQDELRASMLTGYWLEMMNITAYYRHKIPNEKMLTRMQSISDSMRQTHSELQAYPNLFWTRDFTLIPRDYNLKYTLGENKLSLDFILSILIDYENKKEFTSLISDLRKLEKLYEKVEFCSHCADPIVIIVKEGEPFLAGFKGSYIKIPDTSAQSIAQQIEQIRKRVVQ